MNNVQKIIEEYKENTIDFLTKQFNKTLDDLYNIFLKLSKSKRHSLDYKNYKYCLKTFENLCIHSKQYDCYVSLDTQKLYCCLDFFEKNKTGEFKFNHISKKEIDNFFEVGRKLQYI